MALDDPVPVSTSIATILCAPMDAASSPDGAASSPARGALWGLARQGRRCRVSPRGRPWAVDTGSGLNCRATSRPVGSPRPPRGPVALGGSCRGVSPGRAGRGRRSPAAAGQRQQFPPGAVVAMDRHGGRDGGARTGRGGVRAGRGRGGRGGVHVQGGPRPHPPACPATADDTLPVGSSQAAVSPTFLSALSNKIANGRAH